MASSTAQKTLCVTCGKGTGCFTCRGCQQDFCKRHVAEHQQHLSKQLEDLVLDHDQFRQNLNDHIQETSQYQLYTNKIFEWEEESIARIRQVANDARQELQRLINQRTTQLNQSLTEITTELRRANADDDFHELDLSKWAERLNQLKTEVTKSSHFELVLTHNNIVSLIPTIQISKVSEEFFGETIGNVKIHDNGQEIFVEESNGFGTGRSKKDYSSGQHRFRFSMRLNGSDRWLFIGIISKMIPLNQISWNNKSCYGWSGGNRIYIDGVYQISKKDGDVDFETNDIVELLIDCDQSRIQLTNERTQNTHTLTIDKDKCPFPWQINFNLYHVSDRVSFLSS